MAGPKFLNDAALRKLPDTAPVVMVNLVRFKARSSDGNGSGWDAYIRYSQHTMPLIKARGGTVIWSGNAEAVAFGEVEKGRWDYVVLVRYPSRAAFLDMMTSPEYAKANIDRENGVEDHVILATTESYSKLR
jgi:uncharacterized protein (DUF1330 family)